MNDVDFLPAILLPNSSNEQDTAAVLRDKSTCSASLLMAKLGPSPHLRFMVASGATNTARDPRLTWDARGDGSCIVSAAFVASKDVHQRLVSAAVVFRPDGAGASLAHLPAGLPAEVEADLRGALSEISQDLLEYIAQQQRLGIRGGEIASQKKTLGRYIRRAPNLAEAAWRLIVRWCRWLLHIGK